ncbi:flagellar export chaperone FliS [Alicyclobacillus fodiniaquatilis]|uniref:Flagellar secretion chaperone FliS n=1 Tax=Alicyclobacillus fodiniaquatilis TaxID=1661150 RepID=A0ABW4JGM3_9BACL
MAYPQRAFMAYKSTSVQTASREKLVIMLYDGWLSALELAKQAIEQKQLMDAHKQLMKAQSIVHELNNTLDMQYEVSKNLRQLYQYFLNQLIQANVNKDIRPIEEQYPIVKGLRDTWEEAIKQLGAER